MSGGFVDLHAHFVYGVDDGARSQTEMEQMLDAAYADGITTLFATPHVTPGIEPFDQQRFLYHLEEARRYCDRKRYALTLHPGAEILYTPAADAAAKAHKLPTLGQSQRILLEFVPDIAYSEMEEAIGQMICAGYRPIIAHIERYDCLLRHKNAQRLKQRYEVSYQINCHRVLTRAGLWRDWQLNRWFEEECIDFIATDAHSLTRRPFCMRRAQQEIAHRYGDAYARILTSWQD